MARRFIVTAAEMRAAEEAVIASGTSVETLMERAGQAAAEAIWRFAGPLPALVLCGPGNNGGDGYVIARALAERGVGVRIAALGEPGSAAASAARMSWGGTPQALPDAEPAPLLVDCLFGTGLSRGLDPAVAAALMRLAGEARVRVAVDLPSGVATDDGAILSAVPDYDLTIALGALKPAHRLQPAARHMGRIVIADIGVAVESRLEELGRPIIAPPGPDDHKYSRGYAAVIAGEMPGASALAAAAAARAGAGYVRLIGGESGGALLHAVVQGGDSLAEALDDSRIGALAIGPGLGRGDAARRLVDLAVRSGHPLILDADALVLLGKDAAGALNELSHTAVLTPHAGEFRQLFGDSENGKLEAARRAAAETRAVMVYKGADTIVAAPDGRARTAPPAPPWLASAGTGDVLTGIIAAMRAKGMDAFEAACAGVWLHGRAAVLAGPGLVADDLLAGIKAALGEA